MTEFNHPIEAAITNTQEGLEYFWAHLPAGYWGLGRLALCDAVAEMVGPYITRPECRLLEAGCGDAHTTRAILDKYPEVTIQAIGFDWAPAAIKCAKALVPEGIFFHWDLYWGESPSPSWDLVLCVEVLEHLTDYHTALERLLNLCRPGGHLFITVPNGDRDTYAGHVNHWMPDTLHELLSNHRRGDGKHIETGFLCGERFVYGVIQA